MKSDRKSRNDKILIFSIMVCAVLCGIFLGIRGTKIGTIVVVSKNGVEYGRYSLLKEQEIRIGEANTLVINGRTADMVYADCKDRVCVNHTPISKIGETIICLPNKVVVTIETISGRNDKEEYLDVIVK